MSAWTGEEVAGGLETWVKYRRDEARKAGDSIQAEVLDCMLDEARDAAVEGFLPWQEAWLERD